MFVTQSTINLSSTSSKIEVQGDINLSNSDLFLDLNRTISFQDQTLISSNGVFIGVPQFHLINQNPSDCSTIVFNNISSSILLHFIPCPNDSLSIISWAIGGTILFLVIFLATTGGVLRRNKLRAQMDSIKKSRAF
eukprot:TRINITY_DN8925_c0_g1_i1.p1 TRINITY_DN8925_c0_g1~~TRINITY_DN8925_c0_g1_i1.p1  ORF type:complete len:136 (-),score=32.36 TRINITY_DN8925_c0_g1_i1:14-421(-)